MAGAPKEKEQENSTWEIDVGAMFSHGMYWLLICSLFFKSIIIGSPVLFLWNCDVLVVGSREISSSLFPRKNLMFPPMQMSVNFHSVIASFPMQTA